VPARDARGRCRHCPSLQSRRPRSPGRRLARRCPGFRSHLCLGRRSPRRRVAVRYLRFRTPERPQRSQTASSSTYRPSSFACERCRELSCCHSRVRQAAWSTQLIAEVRPCSYPCSSLGSVVPPQDRFASIALRVPSSRRSSRYPEARRTPTRAVPRHPWRRGAPQRSLSPSALRRASTSSRSRRQQRANV